ncbi:MAG: hypothetical protein ACN6RK_16320 [Stenotrophomonas sp.]|jgi:hypothetical protein
MEPTELLTTLLVSIGYRLPIMIALGVAVVMLLDTPRGKVRSVALGALSLLLAVTLIGGGLTAIPLVLIATGNYSGMGAMNTLLSIGHVGLALLEAVGYIMLAWALVQALRRPQAPGKA